MPWEAMFPKTNSPAQIAVFCLVGCLSVVGCCLNLYCYFFLKPIKSYARKLLAFIAFTEAISISGNVLGMIYMSLLSSHSYDDFHVARGSNSTSTSTDVTATNDCSCNTSLKSDPFCEVQAFSTNFFSISSFIYIAGLALLMLQITSSTKPNKLLYYFINIAAWLIPTCITVTVASKGFYGYSPCSTGGWCWLKRIPDKQAVIWFTLAGKFWEVFAFAVMTGSYVSLWVVLTVKKRMSKNASHEVAHTLQTIQSLYLRLLLTPVLFFFCYLFGTLRFYLVILDSSLDFSEESLNAWSFAHGVGNNAAGLCNFVVFVLMETSMREELFKAMKRLCLGSKRNELIPVSSESRKGSRNMATRLERIDSSIGYGTMNSNTPTGTSSLVSPVFAGSEKRELKRATALKSKPYLNEGATEGICNDQDKINPYLSSCSRSRIFSQSQVFSETSNRISSIQANKINQKDWCHDSHEQESDIDDNADADVENEIEED